MQNKLAWALAPLAAAMVLLASCAKTNSDRTANESAVSDAVETQISVINNATSDVNTGNSSIISYAAPAYVAPKESEMLRGDFFDRAGDFLNRLFDNSLHALVFNCSSGSVNDSLNPTSFFGSQNSGIVTRTWSNCVGDAGAFKRNGTVYLGWSSLSTITPYVQNGSILKRATSDLKMTRVSTGNYVEITGNDSSNQVNSTNANQVINWTSVSGSNRTFTLRINETRTGKTSGGATLFQHVVTTPTELTINVDTAAKTRTITSGTIRVQHALANFNVDTTFSSAVWDIDTCQPKSGSATVTISGSRSGSGSVTFNNGTVTFTYEGTSGTLTLPGC